MQPVIVVPADDSDRLCQRGRELAARLQLPYCARRQRTWATIRREENATSILIVRPDRLEYLQGDSLFAFHPGLAGLRALALERGQVDHMVAAMGLQEADQVLDCTLGLASDAVVASFVVGSRGRVVGVEASKLVAAIVAEGLASYRFPKNTRIEAAMRRIEVQAGDHLEFLCQVPDRSFDVVYFDPMFRQAIETSDGISSLRMLANHAPLAIEAIQHAKRVARRCVVIKERAGSTEFARLGVDRTVSGRYGTIAYGVIDL